MRLSERRMIFDVARAEIEIDAARRPRVYVQAELASALLEADADAESASEALERARADAEEAAAPMVTAATHLSSAHVLYARSDWPVPVKS